ncbi:MAG TPA: hypothetical protein VHL58_02220 [Thermoanaerobaculia bacterium]|nr:hypothetical protein [Thermoanaerobaculia bacterium]
MATAITFELYRVKRRWQFDLVHDGKEIETVLFGGDSFLDRLSQVGERMTVEVSVEESGEAGELALVAIEGSHLRGWRLFRRREGEESAMLSPAVLQFFDDTNVLFVTSIPVAEEVE